MFSLLEHSLVAGNILGSYQNIKTIGLSLRILLLPETILVTFKAAGSISNQKLFFCLRIPLLPSKPIRAVKSIVIVEAKTSNVVKKRANTAGIAQKSNKVLTHDIDLKL